MKKYTPTINHLSSILTFSKNISDEKAIVKAVEKTIEKLKFNVVKRTLWHFKPFGITLIYILSESHFAIHTWPEYKTIHLDLVSCTPVDDHNFTSTIKNNFDVFKPISIKFSHNEI